MVRGQKRKILMHERQCIHYLDMIADAVCNVRHGKLGAIEAISNIQLYLDAISLGTDGGAVFIGERFAERPPHPAPATATLPNTPVGEIAGAGSGRQENEIPSVPHSRKRQLGN